MCSMLASSAVLLLTIVLTYKNQKVYSANAEIISTELIVRQQVSQCYAFHLTNGEQQSGKIRRFLSVNQTISVLHKESISNLLYLEKIILSNNNLTQIATAAFHNLPMVKYIYLSNNQLTTVEFYILSEVPNVVQIHMDNNELWYFEQHWFGQILTLEWLNLGHNSIKTIPSGSFENFPNLNRINLEHNLIMHMDENAFQGLEHLEILDVSYNRIYHLQDNIFDPNSGLQVLNLYSNSVSYISDEVLEKLVKLREFVILFNPWQCGCYSKLIQWASIADVNIQSDYLKCGKTKNLAAIPTCVVFSDNLEECAPNKEDMCDILYKQQDFECHFDYEKYINI